eukprot:gb/GFBE01043969.1/.p1 GENE.gb/GFBE01043969.1/~~gb/GFBE01043969.1/.p1  ORF type:complete len:131 (+),score=21.98 gb/GFBE01043969.1/:1-393(+)
MVSAQAASDMRRDAAEIHAMLLARGFHPNTKLWALCGGCSEGKTSQMLTGFFYVMGDTFNGRACFQRVFKPAAGGARVACHPIYIYWSLATHRWHLGHLGRGLAAAFTIKDVQDPTETSLKWMVHRRCWG